jgi:hypothetical protein
LRLRVSKSEVALISTRGWVEDAICFPGGARLVYRLESGPNHAFAADYAADRICVRAPQSAVLRWMRDDEVAMQGEQLTGGADMLEILVEKDFECLKPRPGEDAADLFTNPAKGGA